jgi:hypothetical protein
VLDRYVWWAEHDSAAVWSVSSEWRDTPTVSVEGAFLRAAGAVCRAGGSSVCTCEEGSTVLPAHPRNAGDEGESLPAGSDTPSSSAGDPTRKYR